MSFFTSSSSSKFSNLVLIIEEDKEKFLVLTLTTNPKDDDEEVIEEENEKELKEGKPSWGRVWLKGCKCLISDTYVILHTKIFVSREFINFYSLDIWTKNNKIEHSCLEPDELPKLKESLEVYWKSSKRLKIIIMNNKEFEQLLTNLEDKIQDPNYDERINFALPENPTLAQSIKYSLCQKLLIIQKDNQLTDEQIAKMLNLGIEKTKQILFAHINKFTLDELVNYAEKVIPSNQELVTASAKYHV